MQTLTANPREFVEFVGAVVATLGAIGGLLVGSWKYAIRPGHELLKQGVKLVRAAQHELLANGDGKPSLRQLAIDTSHSVERISEQVSINEQIHWTVHQDSAVGIILMDAKGKILRANRTYLKITGLSLEDLQAEGWRKQVHPDDLARVDFARAESLANGTIFNETYKRRRADGTLIEVRTNMHPIRVGEEVRRWLCRVEFLRVVEHAAQEPAG